MNSALSLLFATAVLAATLPAQVENSAHTLRLADGAAPAPATLADFAWLAGRWEGTGFGGARLEEIWTAPDGTSMCGLFRMTREGRAQVYEFVLLVPVGDSVEMRLKHFTAELKGWEEKDKWVTFRLVRRTGTEFSFEGLTFRLEDGGRTLRAYLQISSKGQTAEQELVYHRVP
jgi:hypothetical protein